METSLTIPKNRIGSSLAAAGIASLACMSTSQGVLRSLFEESVSSSGSNVGWLERALPDCSLTQAEDLYARIIQRTKGLSFMDQETAVMRSDRDTLLHVKDVLSLTGQQLAEAMSVSRGCLYKWLDETTTMRGGPRERLAKLKALADRWSAKVGGSVSRSAWVSGADRARLAEALAGESDEDFERGQRLLDELADLKPSTKPTHRSILEIAKERNWKKLPEHVRQAEWNSRRPSVSAARENS